LPFRRLRAGWVELRFERLAVGVWREGNAEEARSTIDLGHDADHLRQVTLGKDAMGAVVDDTPLSVVLRFESEQKITSTEVDTHLNPTFVVGHLPGCDVSTALVVKVSENLRRELGARTLTGCTRSSTILGVPFMSLARTAHGPAFHTSKNALAFLSALFGSESEP
jgi:hypothetical protein